MASAYILNKKLSILSSPKICNIKRFVCTHIEMCIFLVIIIFLSFDGSMYQFKWDGMGDELAREIERTCIVVDEYVFEKNGWLLRGIVFET